MADPKKLKPKCICAGCSSKQHKKCPLTKQHSGCKEVLQLIDALSEDPACSGAARRKQDLKRQIIPKPKKHTIKLKHDSASCIPMKPSMHTRLRIIGNHCPHGPMKPDPQQYKDTRLFSELLWPDQPDDPGILRTNKIKRQARKKSKVRYQIDLPVPCDTVMAVPPPFVKHTASDKSILRVPSPNISGEVIQAQVASASPSQHRPPVPAKGTFDLRKPRSGLYINETEGFVPDMGMMFSDISPIQGDPKKTAVRREAERRGATRKGKKGQKRPCSSKSPRLKLQKLAQKRRLEKAKRKSSFRGPHYTTLGVPDEKSHRERSTQKHIRDDDSVCGPDEIPRPEQVTIPKNLRRGTLQTHSLTVLPCNKDKKADIHYGILTGSFNMFDKKFGGRSRGKQALTISVMAYCLAFHYHPKQWTMKLIDNLLDSGDLWYQQCLDKVHDHSAVQGMCEVLPFGKKQVLVMNAKRMQMLLSEPDVVGYTLSVDPTVYNLCRGLKVFFKENRAGILLTRVLKVVIWKDRVCYYIFDPAGRNSKAYSNYTYGNAALINVQNLEGVADVLLARSSVEDQKFVLASVKVLRMVDETSEEDLEEDREMTPAEKAMAEYRILNENCAIVNASLHLGDSCFEEAKYRQALPIAIVAMTYAKISPPNTWHTKTLDKVLRLGNKLFMDCSNPKVLIDLTIDNIPNEIVIGPYICEIIIYRERTKGQLFTAKECLFNIKLGLEDFFSKEYNSGILQFNNYSLGVWRQKEMFYLFDPYPRSGDGLKTVKGRACVVMFLNAATLADLLEKNWNYLPGTTQFYIHAFKVLKLRKSEIKKGIVCTLSDEELPGGRKSRNKKVLPTCQQGDGEEEFHEIMPIKDRDDRKPGVDEEHMGDIISLVDSIQEDYLPPIPLRYKYAEPEPMPFKIANLDSPTVSVTQVVPPWPKPRDKTGELPDPDPDPEPTPIPTPPKPEGGDGEEAEEGEVEEEEEEEEQEEEEVKEEPKKEEEVPPPPPSPQPEPELVPVEMAEGEAQTFRQDVKRKILLTSDAHYRCKMREMLRKMRPALQEVEVEVTQSQELNKPSDFKEMPDGTQLVQGSSAITEDNIQDVLPFVAIMAIVTSYKYTINSWTNGIVDFVVNTAKKLYENKQQKFQFAPVHVIPKIAIGHQAYQATISVMGEGATWNLENVLERLFQKSDRAMITTANYSCAVFKRNGMFYLFDGSPCNAVGLRDKEKVGKAVFLRFRVLHALVHRFCYNKDGDSEVQQFVLSRILVQRLNQPPRLRLTRDLDADPSKASSKKTPKPQVLPEPEIICQPDPKPLVGYQFIEGYYKIEGSTALPNRSLTSNGVKACHYVGVVAMLMAAMHPVRTWDSKKVDIAIEKGLEIHEKACNPHLCEKRIVKNILLEDSYFNLNIKEVLIVNENSEKTLEQYLRAILNKLRYVIIRYPECNMVIYQNGGYYHLFDPYCPPLKKESKEAKAKESCMQAEKVAQWILYRSFEELVTRIKMVTSPSNVNSPLFYTYELTSVKKAPKHASFNYRLSPLFKAEASPNKSYIKKKKSLPIVDEKMYWLNVCVIPWSRANPVNDLGFERRTQRTMWRDWDIEFPGDLYSLWGTIHPLSPKFDEDQRGKQILAVNTVALAMTQYFELSVWNSQICDAVVQYGDKYHKQSVSKIKKENHELVVTDLDNKFNMYPYSFSVTFEKIIFGRVYNIDPDRFNLSKALVYFFETSPIAFGMLVSPNKNLAFGKIEYSYFMFDCQSYGAPVFLPKQGASYILKCESLNRLIYCMTLTLNIKRHGVEFDLYKVCINLSNYSGK